MVARDALNNVVDGAYDAKKKGNEVDAAKSAEALATLENVVKRAVGWRAERDGADSFTSAIAAKFDDPKASLEKAGVVVSGSAAAGAVGRRADRHGHRPRQGGRRGHRRSCSSSSWCAAR